MNESVLSYTRARAIEEGLLVDVTETAREVGFNVPVAMTRSAWEDCVDRSERSTMHTVPQVIQSRLWEVLWRAATQTRRTELRQRVAFQAHLVPKEERGHRPRLTVLHVAIGPGDDAEPVATIMQPKEN